MKDVHILDRLPEEFYTPERQADYDPYARIVPSYISVRVERNIPLVRGPDWPP